MDFSNRIGHDNFVWWLGVVEDDKDPLHLGRCRVRIFGSHTPNLELVPTDSLPWAAPANPVNNSKTIETPKLGEYILGFFLDGLSSQSPVMLGVIPGMTQEEPRNGIGFSSLAGEYNNPEVAKINEKMPVPPQNAPAMNLQKVGQPSVPANAYTTTGTMVGVTNSDLVHACDFRFLLNIGDIMSGIGVIENPITLIKKSISDAKNKAAAMVRALLAQLLSNFRVGLKGIILALNLDPTGNLSKIFSQVRDAIRTVNYYSRKLAEIVGNIALVAALIQQLQQIIEWIKTLPQKVLGLLRDCLTTFQNAVKAATSQITAIPGQVSNNLLGAFQNLETSTNSAASQAAAAASSANIPNTLIALVTSPDTANVNVLSQYITNAYPNANLIISNTDSATFNVANSSTP